MKAITIRQPWAWAIAHSTKRIENRTWRPHESIIGFDIAIHAGRVPLSGAARKRVEFEAGQLDGAPAVSKMCSGSIVAVARVAGCRSVPPTLDSDQWIWWIGPYGWELEDVRALEVPIEVRGHQGLWNLPPCITNRVRAQVGQIRLPPDARP